MPEYTILLSKTENTKLVEEQEQARFIKSILESLEVPIEYDPEESLSIEQKQRLRKELSDFELSIIDDSNGGIKIFLKRDLIAEWYKAIYKLKKDPSEPDPSNRLFLEMNISYWSLMFEAEGEENSQD